MYTVKFDDKGIGRIYDIDGDEIAYSVWKDNSREWKSPIREVQDVINVWGRWSTVGGLIDALRKTLPNEVVKRGE